MRRDYISRRLEYAKALGCPYEQLSSTLAKMYLDEHMSAQEIADKLTKLTNSPITARSLQRLLSRLGVLRKTSDAFRLACARGRVKWAYKDPLLKSRKSNLSKSLRYKILKRDGFKCVLCGSTAQETLLEVDHKMAVVHGGKDIEENLRTLCIECNQGKRVIEKEI